MKKKMLMVLMASMMLSMTACGSNNDSKNPETNTQEEAKDDVQKEDVQESENEEPEEVEGLEQYTDKDGNVYYYDRSCVPEWWEGKVEITEVGGLKCLTTVVEDPDNLLIFKKDSSWRVASNKEHYDNGADYDGYYINRYVPEGWNIDYNKSTSYEKFINNSEIGVEAIINVNGQYNESMYWYNPSDEKIYWRVCDENGVKQDTTEKPEYIDYTVQTYEQYKGCEIGGMYDYSLYGNRPYLFVRTYPDGQVYYDGFQIDDDEMGVISMLEEDVLKMQSFGKYIDIDTQLGGLSIAERDVDFAVFAYMYWHKNKKLDVNSDMYWEKRVNK